MGIIISNILDLVKESGEEAIKEFVSRYTCEREIEGGKVSLNPDINANEDSSVRRNDT